LGGGILQSRIPKGSEPCQHRAQARAHGGAAVVGIAHKMVLVRKVEIPENCQAGIANLLCIDVSQVGGIIRLPEYRISDGADQLRWATGGMMEPVARADIGFAKAGLKHGLHGGDGGKQVWTREGQFQRAVSATRNAGDDGGVGSVVERRWGMKSVARKEAHRMGAAGSSQ